MIISLFLIIILGGIVPVAAVDVNSCLNITIPGTYVLRNGILNSNTAVCINISSPNVLFEGSGYTIDGMDNSNSKGINIYNASAALTNITIMNVTLRDWNYGMFVLESQGGRIENVTIESSRATTGQGLLLQSVSGYIIINSTIRSNPYGINFTSSNDNAIANTSATANTFGIYLNSSHRNTLTSNNLSSNTNTGLYLVNSNNNTMIATTANSNTNNGCYLSASANNTLERTSLRSNPYGINMASSNDNTITGTTATANTYGIYLTSSHRNTLTANNLSSNTNTGLYLLSSHGNTIIGTTINRNTNNGCYLSASMNNTMRDTVANNNAYGIILSSSANTSLSTTTVNSNTNTGLQLLSSNTTMVRQTTASWNSINGVLLTTSINNTLAQTTALRNQYGVYFTGSSNNTMTETTASSNTNTGIYLTSSPRNFFNGTTTISNQNGFYLASSSNTTITGATTSSNTYGIYLTSSSNSSLNGVFGQRNSNTALYLTSSNFNSLNNSILSENTNYGIQLVSSNKTTVTNNYLNNTNNLGISGTIYGNTWNVSKSGGTSIVDGPFLGGNFWGKPDLSGFSQITPDTDGDGICDSPYTLATGGNIDYLPLHRPLPVANFTANVTSGPVPLTVSFNDTSTGAGIGLWYWEFGDGTTSSAPNTTHTYDVPGSYDVRLRVTNDGGSDWENRTGFITVTNQTPVANFTANVRSGPVPLTVSFNDTSTGQNITSWNWDFGDGGTDNTPNPVHVYEIPGTFNVSFFVMNDGGGDWENRTAFVTVSPRPTPTPQAYIRISGGSGSTSGVIALYADHIHGGEEYIFDVGKYSSVLSIGISPRETVRDVFLYLGRISSLPETIPSPSTDVYSYFSVSLTGLPYSNLEHAYIDFIVQKVWLSEHGIAPDEIEFVAYHRGIGWVSLPVVSFSEREDHVIYRAPMRDLSHIYAIMRGTHPALARGDNSTPLDILSPLPFLGNERKEGFPIPLNYLYLMGYGAVMFLLGFFCKACVSWKNNSR